MFEDQSQQSELPVATARIGIAIVLFALAVPLGIWVLTIVNSTITGTQTPAIVQKIFPDSAGPFDINTPTGKIEIPKPVLNSLSYFILYLFLIIPLSITIALIKGGVSLLSPDSTRRMRRLIDSIQKSIPPRQ
jgi:hypothetical protein